MNQTTNTTISVPTVKLVARPSLKPLEHTCVAHTIVHAPTSMMLMEEVRLVAAQMATNVKLMDHAPPMKR